MQYESLLYDVRDGIASITLDREKAANALNLQMAKDLMYAALAADEDPEARVVVIAAKGKMFCAGGDLSSFADAGDAKPALLKEITTYLHAAISRFARMDAPVIAAVNGTAAGAGMSLACATDLAICGESAKFTMAYTRVGLTPDGSSTYYLPRLIGARRTLELMLTNRVLSANDALAWGLVNQVVPDAELDATTAKLAASLASGPTASYGATKKLVLASAGESLESQMELESLDIANAARRPDGEEGIAAFLAKRKPAFTGR